jgi:hypothetical protein
MKKNNILVNYYRLLHLRIKNDIVELVYFQCILIYGIYFLEKIMDHIIYMIVYRYDIKNSYLNLHTRIFLKNKFVVILH